MKTLLRLGCLVVAAAVAVGVGRLGAESKEKKPTPHTRIGTINLTYVIKNYEKYKRFQQEIKGIVEPYEKRDAKLRAQLEKLREQHGIGAKVEGTPFPPTPSLPSKLGSSARTPPPPPMPPASSRGNSTAKKKGKDESEIKPAKAEEDEDDDETLKPGDVERRVKELQRQLEDNSAEAKLKLGKKSDEEMRVLFMDICEASQRYATAHHLDMVMHYNDAITKEEYLSAPNIARKLNSGALMPIYTASGIDISKEITEKLNKNVHKE
jgi:Skp family chaperone for outer membrane proteins